MRSLKSIRMETTSPSQSKDGNSSVTHRHKRVASTDSISSKSTMRSPKMPQTPSTNVEEAIIPALIKASMKNSGMKQQTVIISQMTDDSFMAQVIASISPTSSISAKVSSMDLDIVELPSNSKIGDLTVPGFTVKGTTNLNFSSKVEIEQPKVFSSFASSLIQNQKILEADPNSVITIPKWRLSGSITVRAVGVTVKGIEYSTDLEFDVSTVAKMDGLKITRLSFDRSTNDQVNLDVNVNFYSPSTVGFTDLGVLEFDMTYKGATVGNLVSVQPSLLPQSQNSMTFTGSLALNYVRSTGLTMTQAEDAYSEFLSLYLTNDAPTVTIKGVSSSYTLISDAITQISMEIPLVPITASGSSTLLGDTVADPASSSSIVKSISMSDLVLTANPSSSNSSAIIKALTTVIISNPLGANSDILLDSVDVSGIFSSSTVDDGAPIGVLEGTLTPLDSAISASPVAVTAALAQRRLQSSIAALNVADLESSTINPSAPWLLTDLNQNVEGAVRALADSQYVAQSADPLLLNAQSLLSSLAISSPQESLAAYILQMEATLDLTSDNGERFVKFVQSYLSTPSIGVSIEAGEANVKASGALGKVSLKGISLDSHSDIDGLGSTSGEFSGAVTMENFTVLGISEDGGWMLEANVSVTNPSASAVSLTFPLAYSLEVGDGVEVGRVAMIRSAELQASGAASLTFEGTISPPMSPLQTSLLSNFMSAAIGGSTMKVTFIPIDASTVSTMSTFDSSPTDNSTSLASPFVAKALSSSILSTTMGSSSSTMDSLIKSVNLNSISLSIPSDPSEIDNYVLFGSSINIISSNPFGQAVPLLITEISITASMIDTENNKNIGSLFFSKTKTANSTTALMPSASDPNLDESMLIVDVDFPLSSSLIRFDSSDTSLNFGNFVSRLLTNSDGSNATLNGIATVTLDTGSIMGQFTIDMPISQTFKIDSMSDVLPSTTSASSQSMTIGNISFPPLTQAGRLPFISSVSFAPDNSVSNTMILGGVELLMYLPGDRTSPLGSLAIANFTLSSQGSSSAIIGSLGPLLDESTTKLMSELFSSFAGGGETQIELVGAPTPSSVKVANWLVHALTQINMKISMPSLSSLDNMLESSSLSHMGLDATLSSEYVLISGDLSLLIKSPFDPSSLLNVQSVTIGQCTMTAINEDGTEVVVGLLEPLSATPINTSQSIQNSQGVVEVELALVPSLRLQFADGNDTAFSQLASRLVSKSSTGAKAKLSGFYSTKILTDMGTLTLTDLPLDTVMNIPALDVASILSSSSDSNIVAYGDSEDAMPSSSSSSMDLSIDFFAIRELSDQTTKNLALDLSLQLVNPSQIAVPLTGINFLISVDNSYIASVTVIDGSLKLSSSSSIYSSSAGATDASVKSTLDVSGYVLGPPDGWDEDQQAAHLVAISSFVSAYLSGDTDITITLEAVDQLPLQPPLPSQDRRLQDQLVASSAPEWLRTALIGTSFTVTIPAGSLSSSTSNSSLVQSSEVTNLFFDLAPTTLPPSALRASLDASNTALNRSVGPALEGNVAVTIKMPGNMSMNMDITEIDSQLLMERQITGDVYETIGLLSMPLSGNLTQRIDSQSFMLSATMNGARLLASPSEVTTFAEFISSILYEPGITTIFLNGTATLAVSTTLGILTLSSIPLQMSLPISHMTSSSGGSALSSMSMGEAQITSGTAHELELEADVSFGILGNMGAKLGFVSFDLLYPLKALPTGYSTSSSLTFTNGTSVSGLIVENTNFTSKGEVIYYKNETTGANIAAFDYYPFALKIGVVSFPNGLSVSPTTVSSSRVSVRLWAPLSSDGFTEEGTQDLISRYASKDPSMVYLGGNALSSSSSFLQRALSRWAMNTVIPGTKGDILTNVSLRTEFVSIIPFKINVYTSMTFQNPFIVPISIEYINTDVYRASVSQTFIGKNVVDNTNNPFVLVPNSSVKSPENVMSGDINGAAVLTFIEGLANGVTTVIVKGKISILIDAFAVTIDYNETVTVIM